MEIFAYYLMIDPLLNDLKGSCKLNLLAQWNLTVSKKYVCDYLNRNVSALLINIYILNHICTCAFSEQIFYLSQLSLPFYSPQGLHVDFKAAEGLQRSYDLILCVTLECIILLEYTHL